MRRRSLLWLGAAALGVVLVVAGVLVLQDRLERYRFAVAPTHPTPLPFDPGGWASGSATLRHGMARHLIAGRELLGRSRDEIIGRLGPPASEAPGGVLDWPLGQRESSASLMWDYDEYLRVCLDDRGVCREALIWGRN